MAFKILCPGCETKLKLEKQPAKDIKLKCPKCEKVIKVKGAAAPTADADADTEEPATAAPAAAKKAGASAAASKKKAAGAKPAATRKKKKARSAPADDWDDYEDFGDDFEDEYDDDYGEDDYEEPVRKKKSKGKAAGKVTAKGKGKGKGKDKKKPAKSSSGGKGLKISLAVLVGAAIIGGVAYSVTQMGGGDDTSDIPEGADVAAAGGGDGSNAGGGGGGDMVKAGGDDGSPDATGQNIVNMQYLPKQTEYLVHIKVADVLASPLAGKYKDIIPTGSTSGVEFLALEELESVTFASWDLGSGRQASLGLGPIGPAGQQGPGGFGDSMGGSPQDGMGGGFPPMGGGFPSMGGVTPQIPENSLTVIRLRKSVTASDLGQAKSTAEYKGQQIYELTPVPGETTHLWLAESQTLVTGDMKQVKIAIDRGTKEYRFAQFDFVNSNGHVLLAAAPKDLSSFREMAANNSGDPVMDKLAASLAQGMEAVCLSINVTADVGLSIQIDCKDGTNAATIQQDLAAGLELGKTKLSEAMTALGAFGLALRPVQGILDRSQASASGEQVTMSTDIKTGDINALVNSGGVFLGMAMGGMGGEAGGGMPPGMSMSGDGFPDGGFPSGGNDASFGSSMEKSVDYSEDIALTFKFRCARCHNPDKAEGGLSLASYESVMAFSSDAGKAVTPNDPDASMVFKVASMGGAPHEKLKIDEVDKIRGWIEAGAPPPGTKASFTQSAMADAEMKGDKMKGDKMKDAEMKGREMSDADGGEKVMAALSYAKDIAPIAQKYCANCHINQRRGNFSMASYNDIMNHSGRGGKAVQPGNAFTSSLYSLVSNGSMPKGPQTVPKAEADMIMKWISEGAKP